MLHHVSFNNNELDRTLPGEKAIRSSRWSIDPGDFGQGTSQIDVSHLWINSVEPIQLLYDANLCKSMKVLRNKNRRFQTNSKPSLPKRNTQKSNRFFTGGELRAMRSLPPDQYAPFGDRWPIPGHFQARMVIEKWMNMIYSHIWFLYNMHVRMMDQNLYVKCQHHRELLGMSSAQSTISSCSSRPLWHCQNRFGFSTERSRTWWNASARQVQLSVFEAVQLPPLSMQYADFAYWQRQWMAQAVACVVSDGKGMNCTFCGSHRNAFSGIAGHINQLFR